MLMMDRSDVLVRLVLVLVGDDVDDCMTCRPSWLSALLTVDSILLLDRVLVTFATLPSGEEKLVKKCMFLLHEH